jgi:YVTN family beta-propeller protein
MKTMILTDNVSVLDTESRKVIATIPDYKPSGGFSA